MREYHVYGMGAALVDTEIEVDDAFLAANGELCTAFQHHRHLLVRMSVFGRHQKRVDQLNAM